MVSTFPSVQNKIRQLNHAVERTHADLIDFHFQIIFMIDTFAVLLQPRINLK